MRYEIDQVTPDHRSSWYSPQQCKEYYGVPYQFREIQIHWWDDPSKKPSHDGVVDYIKKKTGGSVNYVVSAGKITRMVAEENCALTTQNGNPYGIKLECSPYGTDEDYRTIGWLVANIQHRRGRLPLVPHKKYFPTTCPGTLNLARIQAEADKFNVEEDEMPITATDKQIDETINATHFAAFDYKPEKIVYDTYRPLLRNNYAEGNITMSRQFWADPNSLAKRQTIQVDADGEKWRDHAAKLKETMGL